MGKWGESEFRKESEDIVYESENCISETGSVEGETEGISMETAAIETKRRIAGNGKHGIRNGEYIESANV